MKVDIRLAFAEIFDNVSGQSTDRLLFNPHCGRQPGTLHETFLQEALIHYFRSPQNADDVAAKGIVEEEADLVVTSLQNLMEKEENRK